MNSGATFFLYARKSTDVEDKQVLSIESQLAELRELAERDGLTVVDELIEKRSAKTPGRPIFNAMLERIEAGEALGILAWHPDRLARNSVDGGRIIYLLDVGKLSFLKFPRTWFENTPQGKLMLHNEFGFSKYYVDALSENTRRGFRQKIRRGEYPGRVPFGYLNDYRTKRILVDRERAPLVKEAFERYATGRETLDTIRQWLATRKIISSGGKLVGASTVSKLLSNPIYYGHFKWAGEVHEGNHEPIVSKELFDAVQAIVDRRWKWSPEEQPVAAKPFLGLLSCAECGGAITAEVQKGHTYYRCTKKNKLHRWCSQPYVREEALEAEISALLAPHALREDFADGMLAMLEAEKKQAVRSSTLLAAQKRAELEKLDLRLQKLLDSFLDGVIERETYVTEKARLMSRKKTLEEQSSTLSKGENTWLEPMRNWILEAKTLGRVAKQGAPTEKRILARKVFGSNLVLDSRKACGRAVNPWAFLADNELSSQMVEVAGVEIELNGSRNHFQKRQIRDYQIVGFPATLTGIGRNGHRAACFLTGIGQEFSRAGLKPGISPCEKKP